MLARLRRMTQAALAAAMGGLSLAVIAPWLGVIAEPSMCLGLNPGQAWIGLHLHLVSVAPACANGYAATPALMPAMGITVAISLSVLMWGLLSMIVASGGAVAVRALTRRVGNWLRRRLVLVFEALLPTPAAVPVPVRVDRRPGLRTYSAVQRRGPPQRPGC